MTPTTQNIITTAAAGWLPFGIVPCEAIATDRGPIAASGSRYVVELSHASGKAATDRICLAEFGSRAAADKLAAEVEGWIEKLCENERRRRRPAA